MSDNILNDFVRFIEKSAQTMGGNPVGAAPTANSPTQTSVNTSGFSQAMLPPPATSLAGSGQQMPRESSTDTVSNPTSPGLGNPSHGGGVGFAKPITTAGKPLTQAKWNNAT